TTSNSTKYLLVNELVKDARPFEYVTRTIPRLDLSKAHRLIDPSKRTSYIAPCRPTYRVRHPHRRPRLCPALARGSAAPPMHRSSAAAQIPRNERTPSSIDRAQPRREERRLPRT